MSVSSEFGHMRAYSQFWRCILTVGPFGALLIQAYKSLPFRASKKKTLLQLYSSASSFN
jgi:hypothetical protein